MSSSDGSDEADIPTFQPAVEAPARNVDSLLVETLIHVLVEKGVLTRNDALGIIVTAAQVKGGESDRGGAAGEEAAAALALLKRMYRSFEALEDRSAGRRYGGENVHRLRPPVREEQPDFPRDD